MTKPPRNREEIENIKEKIIKSALEIIINEGSKSFTMRRIASSMKMSATNLYNYFSNKDEIYLAILIKGYEKLYSLLEDAYNSNSDPIKRVKMLIKSYISFGTNNRHYYDIMFTRPAPRYEDYIGTSFENMAGIELELTKKITSLTQNAISGIIYQSQETDPDEEALSLKLIQIWSMLHGMITLHNSDIITYFSETPLDLYDKLIDDFLKTFKQ